MDETETERESSAVQVSELADDPEPRCMSLEETKQLIGYMNTIVDSLLKIVDSGYSPYPVEEIHEIIRDIREEGCAAMSPTGGAIRPRRRRNSSVSLFPPKRTAAISLWWHGHMQSRILAASQPATQCPLPSRSRIKHHAHSTSIRPDLCIKMHTCAVYRYGNGIGSGGARSGNPRPVLGLYRLPTYSNLKQGSRM
ncbi:Os06g0162200 [Oryza sativa Japonica Group]|uniref:Os06g0162200 protein n=1 Tax=Oryza sativa subsp. japonica TaxID=39947 RepID=A0A0P0WT82_ORYSJ|nr:Os06g0162200 [Oryza sativa Japonica Group]